MKININDYSTNILLEGYRGLQLGLKNLWRNKILTSATIIVIAIMLCIFNSILAVNIITQNALNTLNQKVDIVFYLQDDIKFYDANAMKESISQIDGVKTVNYISKQEALNIISGTYPQTTEFLTKFDIANPLPPSISITTETAEDHVRVTNFIENSRFANLIDNQTETRNDQQILSQTAENLININNFARQLIFWIVFIFVIGGALIIINAIQLTIYTRKNEIYIMRLVGAAPNFIRMPFLIEGLVYAIASTLLSFLLIYIVSYFLGVETVLISELLSTVNIASVIGIEVTLTAILSVISSLSTVENFLRKKLSYS